MRRVLDDDLAERYLELIGVDVRPGEVDGDALDVLQRAHLATVPYENLDIVRGSPPEIEPLASVQRILGGRGGYCFHLNGAFAALLEWLDVDLTRRVSGVWGRGMQSAPGPNANHLGLTVRVDGESWLLEVGTGDGPPAPLPLSNGAHEQDGGLVYRLEPSPLAPGGWRLHNDPSGSWHLFDMAAGPAATADFVEMHATLSTSPDSGFVRVATVQRRRGARVDVLRGCVFTERDGPEARARDLDAEDDWWGLVLDNFGLAYGDLVPDERRALWRKVRAAHDAWDAAGRP
jgi:N-hydroxyarylamine O-acetyltransferase